VQETAGADVEEMFRLYATAFVALVRFEQGAHAEAAERLRAALVAIDRLGEGPFRAFLRTALGAIEARRGAVEQARALTTRGLDELAQLRGLPLEAAGRLCEGIVELAEAERSRSPRDAVDVRARLAARHGALGAAPGADRAAPRSFELGLAARWLEQALACQAESPRPSEGPVLVLQAGGRWFEVGDGPRVACGRRPVMRRMLLALARAHRESPGRAIGADELLASTWPGEKMAAESARLRLHVMVSRLRDLGLQELLETTDEGYRLAPGLSVELHDVSDM